MSVSIGDLTERVYIRGIAVPVGRNRFNEQIKTPERVAQRWAKIENISSAKRGGESADPQRQMETNPIIKVTMRDFPGLTTRHSIEWAGSILEIETIGDEGRTFIFCLCKGTFPL